MADPISIDISFVLDRSGSMEAVRDDTIAGFNHFINEQRQVAGEAHLTLTQFDHEYEVVHRTRPLAEVPLLDRHAFVPRGRTALLDAIGRMMIDTGERLARLPEADRPGQVLLVILTDGHENASREFSRERIFQMIQHQREVYNWQVIFLGADQDAVAAAAKYGIDNGAAMSYAGDGQGTRDAMSSLNAATHRFRRSGRRRADSFFTDQEREANRPRRTRPDAS